MVALAQPLSLSPTCLVTAAHSPLPARQCL